MIWLTGFCLLCAPALLHSSRILLSLVVHFLDLAVPDVSLFYAKDGVFLLLEFPLRGFGVGRFV